jgi:menaquinone-dependent protoporphyrinogen oxidase
LKANDRKTTKKEDEMDKVLVAYGTKYGGTAEIAEKIGQVLREAGLRADVHPADRVSDLTPYQAVVLGSGVYIGRWRKEAATFLKANEQALAERPVWLFSSGPTGEGDPVELTSGWRLPKALQPVADRIQPRDVAVFHGVMDGKKLNPIEKWTIKNVKAPIGDFRDWDAITAWAMAIADVLKEAGWGSGTQSA